MTLVTFLTRKPLRAAMIGALALTLPIASMAPVAPAIAQQSRLEAAATALRSISTMKADFTQTDRQGQTVKGVLTLKNPGKIRFQYQDSVPLLVVSNGKSLTLVDYEVNQVQRWPIRNSPLGALLNPGSDITQYGKVVESGHPDTLAVEVRDAKRPEFGVLTLILLRNANAPGGWQLTNWVSLDSQNNRTTVRLSKHRYGMAVAESAFTYKDPRRTTRRPR